MEARKVRDMSDKDYHGGEGISSTQLKDILISPAYYHAKHIQAIQREEKPAFVFGRLVHALVSEPETVAGRFITAPDVDRRTKAGKAAHADFIEQAKGLEIISKADRELAETMAETVISSPLVSGLFSAPGEREQSWFKTDEETGLLLKCRPDLRIDGFGIVDLKTISPRGQWQSERLEYHLRNEIRSRGYHISAAFYCDITSDDEFLDLFISTKPGDHWVAPYQLGADELELGRMQYRKALRLLAECMSADDWPSICPGFIQGSCTAYERQLLEDQGDE